MGSAAESSMRDTIRATLDALLAPDQIVELRALRVRMNRRIIPAVAGFFDGEHRNEMATEAVRLSLISGGVYCTFNPLSRDILSRRANRVDVAVSGDLAGDAHVVSRRWLLVDVDPRRISGISATGAEKAKAAKRMEEICDYLTERHNWAMPVRADSGNGYHALFRIDLPTADDGLVQRTLAALDKQFSDDAVAVDTSVYNPARIVKLYGTWSRKGDDTPDRPHRLSRILTVPDALTITSREQLLIIAGLPGARGSMPTRAPSNGKTNRLDVPRWLTARGRVFRIKPVPDKERRFIFVLSECPFDVSHGMDSCVMQDTDGKMSAHCFHDSCSGRGWQDFKLAIGEPDADHYDPPLSSRRNGKNRQQTPAVSVTSTSSAGDDERVEMDAGQEDLATVTPQAIAALMATNDPPRLFMHGLPVRLERDDQGAPVLRELTRDRLRHELARAIRWIRLKTVGEAKVKVDALPPRALTDDVLATPNLPLPVLARVVEAPIFAADGLLHHEPGYHPATRAYYQPAVGFSPTVPPNVPTDQDVAAARDMVLAPLAQFPFVSESERAHAIAAMLLPFVRDVIDGPTPLHLFEAPTPGTGKTLLVDTVTFPALGRIIAAMTEGRDEDEWRKRIFGKLRSGPSSVLLDNLRRRLDSAALASALTAYPSWEDRILGVSETQRVPVRCLWLATGNNPALSNEMTRRTIRIRLDAKTDRPWLRTGFIDLQAWLREHRSELVAAVLTIVRAWFQAGQPAGKRTIGMYERWAIVMGGILDVAGVPGFLANLDEFYAEADSEGETWRAFIADWWIRFGTAEVTVADLWPVATPLIDLTGAGKTAEHGQRVRLGRMLRDQRDRVYCIDFEDGPTTLRLERGGEHRRAVLWRLCAVV